MPSGSSRCCAIPSCPAGAADLAALRRLSSLFLATKEFHGAAGFVVTDEMAVAVAAQACLPILHLGLQRYDGFVGIVMHESEVVARREVTDEDGIVHAYDEELAGEAMEGGPVMLAWQAVASSDDPALVGADAVYNVVIHEFAHVLDMQDGIADGVPLLARRLNARPGWPSSTRVGTLLCARVDAGEETLIDPMAPRRWKSSSPWRPRRFHRAQTMQREEPGLFALLAGSIGTAP